MATQERALCTDAEAVAHLPLQTCTTSLQGSCALTGCETDIAQTSLRDGGTRGATLAMWTLQAIDQGHHFVLSGLRRALDSCAGRDLQARPSWETQKSAECWLGVEPMVGWWERVQQQSTIPKTTECISKGKTTEEGERQRQEVQEAPGAGAPSFPSLPVSPFTPTGSYTAATSTTPWATEKTGEQTSANQELIQAVRKAYPDPSGMPSELKDILDKTENLEMKKITSDLHKSTAALGRATRQLQELQESKMQHRQKWMLHLTASLEAWKSQMESYDKQQHQFNALIQQATTELHAARKSIQQLNAKAAHDKPLETLPEESTVVATAVAAADGPVDAEEQALRAQMQALIAGTAKLALPAEVEVVDVEAIQNPSAKRQRSEERKDEEMKGTS